MAGKHFCIAVDVVFDHRDQVVLGNNANIGYQVGADYQRNQQKHE